MSRQISRTATRTRSRALHRAAAAAACRCEALERRILLSVDYGIIQGAFFEDTNDNGILDEGDLPHPGFPFKIKWEEGEFDYDGRVDTPELGGGGPGSDDDIRYEIQIAGGMVSISALREQDREQVISPIQGTIEVEVKRDEVITVNWLVRRPLDWGDAPDGAQFPVSYPTLRANNGAHHRVLQGYSLGALIDAEPDGQPHPQALGDDLNGLADEDGVTFLTPLVSGSTAQIRVDFTSTMGLTGVLDAWIDFNGNGNWGDFGERIANGFVLSPGANILNVSVPASAVPGMTFARFRLSPNGVSTFTGTGLLGTAVSTPVYGEVEDHMVRIEAGQQLDWGDAPDGMAGFFYPTLAANNGARHQILQGFTLGRLIDAEPDGQPTIGADGDDLNGIDDEDGVVFLTPFVPGQAAQIQVELNPAASGGFLSAWIDWNGNGTWTNAGEQIFNGQPLVPGFNVFNVPVPTTAKVGQTYARFRLGQTPNAIARFEGFGGFGEVEDYLIRIDPPLDQVGPLDWGDAPNIAGSILSYPTLASQNGARHRILEGFMLGHLIDAEPDGQPTIGADGDDNNGLDDEDGITFLDPLIPGQPARIEIFLTNTAGLNARLDAWIDWHADGTWMQFIDRIATAVPLNPGPNILVVNVPTNAAAGTTYARFRLSRDGVTSSAGFGGVGEVEDYRVEIRNPTNRRLDWGDAPEGATFPTFYHTLAVNNGARHLVTPGFQLGYRIDAEPDGQPTFGADGDDLNGINDEDGVIFLTPLVPGGAAQIQVLAPAGGVLDAWIDWHANWNWSDAVDRIATGHVLSPGINVLAVSVPADAKVGPTYARFRLSRNGVASFDGFGGEGEVEDYLVRIRPGGGEQRFDWGDAPKSYGTLAADNGAHHRIVPGFILGYLIDAEPDGQPSIGANGDDLNGVDDEDGVFLPGGLLVAGTTAQFSFYAPNGGVLDGWIDLNGNGNWDDPGEHVFASVALAPGVFNLIPFNVPGDATPGTTYARFRLSREGIGSPYGFGGDGEVEDYRYRIAKQETPQGPFDWGDAPDSRQTPIYPTLGVNNGAHHSFRPGFTLGHRWDAEFDGQPHPQALGDDLNGIDDEDGVQFLTSFIPGQMARILVIAPMGGMLDAWIDWDADGNWTGPDDRIFTAFPLAAGANVLDVPVPAGLSMDMYRTYARFRLSEQGVASFTGYGGDGEVEDYMIFVNGPTFTLTPAPTPGTVTLTVVGTPNADHVLLNYNEQSEMLEINFTPPDSGMAQMPDFLVPFSEISELNIALGDGNDTLYLGLNEKWFRGRSGTWFFDGGAGFNKLILDASATEGGLDFVIQADLIQLNFTRFMPDGVPLRAHVMGFDHVDISGGGLANTIGGGAGEDRLRGEEGNTFLLARGWYQTAPIITLNGSDGNDQAKVFVDSSFKVPTELNFHGGAGADSLSLFGDGSVSGSYMPLPGSTHAGIIAILIGMLHFTGLEPVNVAGFAEFELELPPGATGNDQITIDALSLDIGDSSRISGTSSGTGFEELVITDVDTFTLDVAANDAGGIGGSSDIVNFNGSIIGAGVFVMPAGLANLTLNVNAGVIPINWNPGALGAPVTVNVAGGAAVHFGTTQHLDALNIAGGGTAVLRPGRHTVVTQSLLIGGPAAPGRLDITDGSVIVNYTGASPFMSINDWIKDGRAGGTWDGNGITSSNAAADGQFAVGIGDNAVLDKPTFAGHPVGSSSILLTLTFGGDANLDWKVNISDLSILAGNWQQSPRFWHHGNSNYDDIVNIGDLSMLAGNWQKDLGPPPFSDVLVVQADDEEDEEEDGQDDAVKPPSGGRGAANQSEAAAKTPAAKRTATPGPAAAAQKKPR